MVNGKIKKKRRTENGCLRYNSTFIDHLNARTMVSQTN